MRATLHITAGAYAGRNIVLREGQTAQFGRTEWADFSFPADNVMSDVHFRVQCAGRQCLVQDLQSHSGTLVDGREVSQQSLRTGSVITAGKTSFLVVLGDETLPSASPPPPAVAVAPSAAVGVPAPAAPAEDWKPLAKRIRLSKPALALRDRADSVTAYVQQLLDAALIDDALGMAAAALPPQQAVAWIVTQLRGMPAQALPWLDAENEAALQLAEQWLAEPSEETARQAEAAANALNLETPAAWAAFAAFLAEGNLGPPGGEVIEPPAGICGNAARTGLLLASAALPPAQIPAARRAYVAAALAELTTPSP